MIKEKLGVHKQYLVISAPIPFKLIANNGTDFVQRSSGIWQLDCYKLLPEKFMRNYPVFNLELEYNEELIPDGFNFEYYFTNLNLGDSLKGVSGDLVELSEKQLDVIISSIEEQNEILRNQKIDKPVFGGHISSYENPNNIDNLNFVCFSHCFLFLKLENRTSANGGFTSFHNLYLGFNVFVSNMYIGYENNSVYLFYTINGNEEKKIALNVDVWEQSPSNGGEFIVYEVEKSGKAPENLLA